ncbi:Lrp/AsnC ligand binding domain-containing protein [Pontibacter akesuensis]|uniref:Lrp/AsnC family transcriptional regulator, regulator for asnA, asnC and gidA n=1 Tax=Pontibacter akesuensis TaxID=388950 RepID=A0A1I7IAE7_9BACT|nr:Lrp/AsnC ligand binding domain-containing protein [Pontibacter akesuensis]GHA66067.1 transcriptional regulator [Pontibacter akesuensis]SFU69963.1 Lrp/AsnC family transcriptional regulator, regulator for asnA, asnC and gidA [Pontibacter akesuensis]
MNYEIDNLDKQILSLLMLDVMRPYTDIAKELGVSGGTIHVRMKKLSEMGVVKGAQLLVNPSAVGFDICAFIGVFLEKGSEYNETVAKMRDIPEIVELHYTTGSYSMFAKIICRDTNHLREVLNEKLQSIAGVQRTETLISLEESINRQIRIN